MQLNVDSPVARWRDRLARQRGRLEDLVQRLGSEEAGWSPDVGIASVKDHLHALAGCARGLRQALSGRERSGAEPAAESLTSEEIVKALRSCDDVVAAWLDRATDADLEEGLEDGGGPCVEELLHDYSERFAHHVAASRLLLQLIAPDRLDALRVA